MSFVNSGVTGPNFVKFVKFHEIFTRNRGIIYAVNDCVIDIPSVSECQRDESGEFAIFHKIGCHGNVP